MVQPLQINGMPFVRLDDGSLVLAISQLTADGAFASSGSSSSFSGQLIASEAHIGAVGGHTAPITASKTRPNDTSAYAANDGIAEATSGATVWTFTGAARISGGSGIIVGAQVKCTNAANVARIEVDLYDSAPAAAINDNAEAVQLVADVAKFIATLTLPALAKKTTSSTFAIARDNTIRQAFKCSGSANLIGIVRTLDAFTPTAQSIYSLTLDCIQD
jgi:hypothetical protein